MIKDKRLCKVGINTIIQWRKDVILYLWQGKYVVKFALEVLLVHTQLFGSARPLLQVAYSRDAIIKIQFYT